MNDQPETEDSSADFSESSHDSYEISFTPVPRLRKRRGGWSEENQRAFIAALARCGSVARAARSVGLSARGAYRLLDAPNADDFARAWDDALDLGRARLQVEALDRAMNGYRCEIYRRGKLVRVEQRFNDRLAIALLGGRERTIHEYVRSVRSTREYRQMLKAQDEEKRRREEAYQAELDEIMRKAAATPRSVPRIRAL